MLVQVFICRKETAGDLRGSPSRAVCSFHVPSGMSALTGHPWKEQCRTLEVYRRWLSLL